MPATLTNQTKGETTMTTKQIDDIKRLLAEATPGPWALHNETCVSSGDTMTAQTCDDEPENTPQAEQNAALIVAAVNALPDILADLEEVIRDRNEWADSTRGANKRMREAEDRVKLLLCDLEAAQKREQVLREAVKRAVPWMNKFINDGRHIDTVSPSDCLASRQMLLAALDATEVKP
jgi:hypothetical protein